MSVTIHFTGPSRRETDAQTDTVARALELKVDEGIDLVAREDGDASEERETYGNAIRLCHGGEGVLLVALLEEEIHDEQLQGEEAEHRERGKKF